MENRPNTAPVPPSAKPRQPKTPPILQTTFAVAILLATLFTAATPSSLFSGSLTEKLAILLTPEAAGGTPAPGETAVPQIRIGLVPGHWGNDAGAVCQNGTTEADVNLQIANLVQQRLNSLPNVQVDLLKEFDPRLQGYQAALLISIHNDSCDYINEEATGYKVAAALGARDINRATRLAQCLTDRYGRTTALKYHPGSITRDMTEYHAFGEINQNTPAAIIETGFLFKDYDILTQRPDVIADGVVNGILCFLNNETVDPTTVP